MEDKELAAKPAENLHERKTREENVDVDRSLIKHESSGNIKKRAIKDEDHSEGSSTKNRFECHRCGQSYAQKKKLSRHVKTHPEETRFACNICGYKTARKSNYKHHMKAHTRSYDCSVCGHKSTNKFALKRHMTTHSERNP